MQDSNLRPLAPKASAIPDYANSHFVIGPGLEPKLIESKSIVLTNYTIRQFEQVRGIEPPSPTWKEGVMAIIRHLLLLSLLDLNQGPFD
jgi:hypothetical protein